MLTPKAYGNVPASVTERADALRAKGIPDKSIKAALDQLGLEETPYKRDSFGNIIAPLFGQNGKNAVRSGQAEAARHAEQRRAGARQGGRAADGWGEALQSVGIPRALLDAHTKVCVCP